MKRYTVWYHNMQKVCGSYEHTFCNYNRLRIAKAAANKLWNNKEEYGGVWKVSVYDTQTPAGFSSKLVYEWR